VSEVLLTGMRHQPLVWDVIKYYRLTHDCCCLLLPVAVDPCSLPTVAFWSFNNINAATQEPAFGIPPSLGLAGAQVGADALSNVSNVGFDTTTFDPADTAPGINQSYVVSIWDAPVSPTPFGTLVVFLLSGQYTTGLCCSFRYLCELTSSAPWLLGFTGGTTPEQRLLCTGGPAAGWQTVTWSAVSATLTEPGCYVAYNGTSTLAGKVWFDSVDLRSVAVASPPPSLPPSPPPPVKPGPFPAPAPPTPGK
jgi:hypothetical protein